MIHHGRDEEGKISWLLIWMPKENVEETDNLVPINPDYDHLTHTGLMFQKMFFLLTNRLLTNRLLFSQPQAVSTGFRQILTEPQVAPSRPVTRERHTT